MGRFHLVTTNDLQIGTSRKEKGAIRDMPKEIMIPPMSGAIFIVKRGQTIKVIDVRVSK